MRTCDVYSNNHFNNNNSDPKICQKKFPSNCRLITWLPNEVENSKGTNSWGKLNIIFCGTEIMPKLKETNELSTLY